MNSGIDYFKEGYQPKTDIVRDEKGGLFTDAYIILDMRRNLFTQFFYIHVFNCVRQTEIHTAEPLVPELIVSEFKMAIERTERQKAPSVEQVPADVIKAGGRTILSEIH
jgi:hypothetical protein